MSEQPTTVKPWGRGRLCHPGRSGTHQSRLTGRVRPGDPLGRHPPHHHGDRVHLQSAERCGRAPRHPGRRAHAARQRHRLHPGRVPAATPGPTVDIPGSSVIGASKVASGFPHTPGGCNRAASGDRGRSTDRDEHRPHQRDLPCLVGRRSGASRPVAADPACAGIPGRSQHGTNEGP